MKNRFMVMKFIRNRLIGNRLIGNRTAVFGLIVILCALALSGCGDVGKPSADRSNEDTEDAGEGSYTQIANPWEDTDAAGVESLIGHAFKEADTMKGITYRMNKAIGMGELNCFLDDDIEICLRAQHTDQAEDISGMYYNWEVSTFVYIGDYVSNTLETQEDGKTIQVCNWYNEAEGISYSVSAEGDDLEGFDIRDFLEAIVK